jgi:HTH-type transcriptional regulator/antitoxin HigA
MKLQPIRTEDDHASALARIETLWNAPPGSREGDELEALAILVEAYEQRTHPIGPPHPIEALRFAMEQRGMTPKDLSSFLGSSGRVSEILQRKRALTLPMIRKLHKKLGLGADVLIREYELRPPPRGAARPRKKPALRPRRAGSTARSGD